MKKSLIINLLLVLLSGKTLFGQLSEGGYPHPLPPLKNASVTTIAMPFVSNESLRWKYEQDRFESVKLKPFTFAHPFDVNISPLTQGTWYRTDDGWWVWRVTIRSEGALSLNLLFREFRLPDKARLFIYTPAQEKVLGAYTKNNNTPERVFLVSPLPGDEITIQYETREIPGKSGDFVVAAVNHDFTGILKYTDSRRPMGYPAGTCQLDVSCNTVPALNDPKNSVCRIMIMGRDLCTGTLVNNTSQNGRPYVLTANHCIDTAYKAPASLFLFNYESPYCGSLDGDVSNSLTGSTLKARLTNLDFSLVELTTPPPPAFRPYYAGWTRITQIPDTVVSVHHPLGDIKKITTDYNAPLQSNWNNWVTKGFWHVLKWDAGTTEIGSSGGPMFTRDGLLIGSLSGGYGTCSNPTNDYFTRFDMAWDYNPDSAKQLKYWLDPAKTNPVSLKGKQFNTGPNLCGTVTNLVKGDAHQLLRIRKSSGENGGFWTGSNSEGIREIAEIFTIPGKEQLQGVSLGIGRKYHRVVNNFSYIIIKIYNVKNKAVTLFYAQDTVYLKNLVTDAMNLVKFKKAVQPADTFLLAVNLEHIIAVDTLAFYHTLRSISMPNTFLLNKTGTFTPFLSENQKYSSALAFELVVCNIGDTGVDTLVDDTSQLVQVYPNPTQSVCWVNSKFNISADMVSVFNMLGRQVRFVTMPYGNRKLGIGLQGNPPGIYLLRIRHGNQFIQNKILYFPAEQ